MATGTRGGEIAKLFNRTRPDSPQVNSPEIRSAFPSRHPQGGLLFGCRKQSGGFREAAVVPMTGFLNHGTAALGRSREVTNDSFLAAKLAEGPPCLSGGFREVRMPGLGRYGEFVGSKTCRSPALRVVC